MPFSGVYTSNLFNDLDFYLGQILSLYEAKYLGQVFSQTFCFIEGQYLAQIKFQVVQQIGCVDAALGLNFSQYIYGIVCHYANSHPLFSFDF